MEIKCKFCKDKKTMVECFRRKEWHIGGYEIAYSCKECLGI